jgi:hypothetical protein
VLDHLADSDGIILRRDAVALGYDDNYLARARRAGDVVRVRQGAYVLTPLWEQADRVGKHLLLVGAVVRLYDDRVAVSHQSACVTQGGPDWGLDLSNAHLTNLYGIGERRAARITHHRGACRVGDVSRDDRGWITSPTRSALDTAMLAGRDPAVCVLDWYLNKGLVTEEELRIGLDAKTEWADTLALFTRVQLCDGRSESVGETRSRLLCVDRKLPTPELQFRVRHPDGFVAGRTDFAWPEYRLLGEFDGLHKYLRTRRPGETIEQAVLREKAREDLLRELTGWTFIRLVWADLATPAATEARIRRALGRAAA